MKGACIRALKGSFCQSLYQSFLGELLRDLVSELGEGLVPEPFTRAFQQIVTDTSAAVSLLLGVSFAIVK